MREADASMPSTPGRLRPALAAALVAVLAATMLPAAPLLAPAEAAHQNVERPVTLSPGRAWTSAVWDGTHAYVFGGAAASGSLDEILRYDPATNEVRVMGARLPSPRHSTSAVWTGTAAYVFGGTNGTATDEIVRYDPATDTVEVLEARLPSPRYGTAAVWTGEVAYVIGGVDPADWWVYTASIVGFDPAAPPGEAVWTTGVSLFTSTAYWMGDPHGLGYPSAVWTGTDALIFSGHFRYRDIPSGGSCYNRGTSTWVLRFTPGTPERLERAAVLPHPTYGGEGGAAGGGAVWDGRYAYLFGGEHYSNANACQFGTTSQDAVLRYEPTTGELRLLQEPWSGAGWSAAWTGDAALLFGGLVAHYTPNRPPVARIAGLADQECTDGQAVVTLDGTGSSDVNGDALAFAWTAPTGIAFDDATSPAPTASFPLGTTHVALAVHDGEFGARAEVEVRVVDTLPPMLELERPEAGSVYLLNLLAVDTQQGAEALAVGPLTARAEASDQCGLARVTFGASDGERGEDAEAPFEFRVEPVVPFAGAMVLNVTAVDVVGRTADHSVQYLHVATSACPVVFGGGDECSIAGVEPPVDPGLPAPVTPLPVLEDGCRLVLGDACRELLGG